MATSCVEYLDLNTLEDMCDYDWKPEEEPELPGYVEQGIHGEIMMENYAIQELGYERTDFEPEYHGIDNVFRDGDDLVIAESKTDIGFGPDALKTDVHGHVQVDEDWVREKAEEMLHSEVEANRELGQEIIDRLDSNKDSIRYEVFNTNPALNDITHYEKQGGEWAEIDPFDER